MANMKKIFAAAGTTAALGASVFGGMASPAHAATPVVSTGVNQAPCIYPTSWLWGGEVGNVNPISVPKGYHVEWHKVVNANEGGHFWVKTDKQTKRTRNVTLAQIKKLIADGTITKNSQWGYDFSEKEVIMPSNFNPNTDKVELFEGDLVNDSCIATGKLYGGGETQYYTHVNTYNYLVQLDQEKVTKSAWFANKIADADNDGVLKRGELKNYVYGTVSAHRHVKETSRVVSVTLRQKTTPTNADIIAQVKKQTGVALTPNKVGKVTTMNSVHNYGWVLAKGSTVKAPFAGGDQVFLGSN